MPFVVVITAVAIVNNGDDNACALFLCSLLLSFCSSVVLPRLRLLAEEVPH